MRPTMDVTLRDTYNELLARMEQTVPFPMDVEEFYLSLFPSGLQPFMSHVVADQADQVEARNARVLFRRSREVVVYCGNIPLDWAARGKMRDLYIRLMFPFRVPAPIATVDTPSDALGTVILPAKHPRRKELLDWAVKAQKLDTVLSRCQLAFEAVEEDIDLLEHWHELASATRQKIRKRRPPAAVLDRLNTRVPPEERQEINAILASAVILPDLKFPHAWVGLNQTRSYWKGAGV